MSTTARVPLSALVNKPFRAHDIISSLKKPEPFSNVAPKGENKDKASVRGPSRRYTLEQLRQLNPGNPADPLQLWPEEDFAESDSPGTPGTVGWSVSNTPCTAPARLHSRRGDDLMTPMRAKTPSTKLKAVETDSRRLGQRGKQIQYGKSTLGYRLCRIVSATEEDAPADLPRTPKEGQKCSKRCWDAQVREWRVKLHGYDPKTAEEWRVAYQLFPKEALDLAAALDKSATQFSASGQCMPPADIVEEARALAAAAARRGPVARSLNLDEDEAGEEDDEEQLRHQDQVNDLLNAL